MIFFSFITFKSFFLSLISLIHLTGFLISPLKIRTLKSLQVITSMEKILIERIEKNIAKVLFPTNPLFYLELAFYLSIPSSNEIEKFMNHHGYSIKSQMTFFQDICCRNNTYHILYKDFCKWIDAGIDYNLINELFRYQLEVKETRKS